MGLVLTSACRPGLSGPGLIPTASIGTDGLTRLFVPRGSRKGAGPLYQLVFGAPGRGPTGETNAITRVSVADLDRAEARSSGTKWFTTLYRKEPFMRSSTHRLLVVANETATDEALITELRRRQQEGPVVVHLVVAALTTHLRHWLSDTDLATSDADARVDAAVTVMREAGITLTAEAGDSRPILAISDALVDFAADELLISTLPVERSHWLERNIVSGAESRFSLPVTHIISAYQPERSEDMLLAASGSAR
jgi:hypothetical protein